MARFDLIELKPCGECGMPCKPNEYHPYAACLMFKGCHNSTTVRANLSTLSARASAGEGGDELGAAELRSQEQRAMGWDAICNLLFELRPKWTYGAGTGIELAVATIRAALTAAPQPAQADEVEGADMREFERRNAAFVNALPRKIVGSNSQPAQAGASGVVPHGHVLIGPNGRIRFGYGHFKEGVTALASQLALALNDTTPASPATGDGYREALDAIDAAHELSGSLAERITALIRQRDELRDRLTPQPAAARGGCDHLNEARAHVSNAMDDLDDEHRAMPQLREAAYHLGMLAAATQPQEAPARMSAWVGDMKTSAGMDYYVCVGRDTGNPLNRTYLTPNKYSIRGRAEYDVAEWNHLLGHGPKPDILAFDTDATPPAHGDGEGDHLAMHAKLRDLLAGKSLYVMGREHFDQRDKPLYEIVFGMAMADKILFSAKDADYIDTRPTPEAQEADALCKNVREVMAELREAQGYPAGTAACFILIARAHDINAKRGEFKFEEVYDEDGESMGDWTVTVERTDAALALPAQGEGK